MSIRKGFALFLVLTILCCLPVVGLTESDGELLINGSFEQLDGNGMPTGWVTDAYIQQEGYTTFSVSDDAYDGQYSATINNLGANDARFSQTVKVEPESLYCLSGYIKTEDVLDSGRGANLSIEGLYVFSESVYGTSDGWQYIEFYGETGEEQTEVTIFARLGGYSGESIGKAQFDQLSLHEVNAVPGSGVASIWFKQDTPVIEPVASETDTETASPFWPYLLVISVGYAVLAAVCLCTLTLKRRDLTEPKKAPLFFLIGMFLALTVRLAIAYVVEGYPVDVNCFLSWGSTMKNVGPTAFYEATNFCDYPPAYVYVLGLCSLVSSALPMISASFIFKFIPIFCDLAGAYLLYSFARREGQMNRQQAGMMGLIVAFCPAFIINSAAWCQMDSVLCVGLMLVAILAIRRKWAAVLPVYVLCALIKPQALMLGFLGLTAIVVEWVQHKEARKPMLIGVGLSVAVAAVVLIPFSINQQWDWLIGLYGRTLASYPYATVNTANFYYLFDANWAGVEEAAHWIAPAVLALGCAAWGALLIKRQKDMKARWLEPVLMFIFAAVFAVLGVMGTTWGAVGTTAMVLAFALVLPMYVRGGKLRNLPLLGGILFLLLYVIGVKMHERYLFPALLFFAMAFVFNRDKRIFLLLILTSCTMFVNEGIVLDNALRLGASMGHLNQDTLWLNRVLSVLNVLSVLPAVWVGHRICVEGHTAAEDETIHPLLFVKKLQKRPCRVRDFATDSSLHWKRIDWVLMLSVTLVYAVVALWNLGSTKAPQNPWKSTAMNESVTIDLGHEYDDFRMLYFAQVSYSNFGVAVSTDGEHWSAEWLAEMDQGECFRWKYLTQYTVSGETTTFNSSPRVLSGRYVRITAQQIGLILDEVVFRTADGEVIPATICAQDNANAESPLLSDAAALLDEQDTLEGEPSWYNGTYFDEIYHARTAFEHLNGTVPYETTHPPLGKLLMAVCVAIFGMTPFGWRFAGALMGILMLPAMYLLGKQLTKRSSMGFAAMTMMALDCMHLTQTRIATIDSFPVLFIILSYFFMLRFMQRDIVREPIKKVLPDLALSGLFMGFGIASKWIGIYAGAGLAILYFWTCFRHMRLSGDAFILLKQKDASLSDEESAVMKLRADETFRRVMTLCLWCVLFFVAVPVVIYLLSYIPYFAYTEVTGIGDFLKKVIAAQQNMFNYHATPGLGMDHPYYSPWYEWPLIKKPMWYAMARYLPEGVSYSIFCFGNPAVWLVGLAGIGATLVVWLHRHRYTLESSDMLLHTQSTHWSVAPAFVLLGLTAQFLPWVVVPRGTYIYHYFASVPFLIFGTTLLLHWFSKRFPKTGRIVTAVYLVICLVVFIGFYPYASGTTVSTDWLDYMKKFLHIYY